MTPLEKQLGEALKEMLMLVDELSGEQRKSRLIWLHAPRIADAKTTLNDYERQRDRENSFVNY
jgi:hypothetical protein